MPSVKGRLITIYGINNIGKSTQAKLLVRHLKKLGKKSLWIKFPVKDVRPSGEYLYKVIRAGNKQHISEAELQLWFVINRHQFQPKLEKLLKDGYYVVAEDYTGTGIAWGMAKGLSEDFMMQINQRLIKEDLSILMEGKRFLNAKEASHIHEQNDKLVEKCKKIHSTLGKKFGWKSVKVQKGVMETAKIIFKVVDDFFKTR